MNSLTDTSPNISNLDNQRRSARPRALKLAPAVLIFLGVTAMGGGTEMLLFPKGNQYLPRDFLDELPVDSFIFPGLMLLLVFGIGSLIVAWGMLTRRHLRLTRRLEERIGYHWSWIGAVAVGVGFTTWMVVEIALLGPPWEGTSSDQTFAWVLYGIYLSVAAVLLLVPHTRSVRASFKLEPRRPTGVELNPR